MTYYFRVFLTAVAITISGCAQQSPFLHTAKNQQFDGMRVAVLEPEVTVNELGIASLEEVPEWTDEATKNIDAYLTDLVGTASSTLDIRKAQEIPDDKQDYLDEHLALYQRLSLEFVSTYRQPAWKAHRDKLDMRIGDGLALMKDELEADAVLVVIGDESVSSGGRIASAVVMAAVFGVAMPMGHALIHVGLIDLDTGKIIWTNTTYNPGGGLRTDREARFMMSKTLESFPAEIPPKPKSKEQLAREKKAEEKRLRFEARNQKKIDEAA
ncbi:MAG: hypothetical protein H7A02_03745 [Pseudomonadales bacterium]|nr:hypothetical protein [Pseudomonadales bacterium]